MLHTNYWKNKAEDAQKLLENADKQTEAHQRGHNHNSENISRLRAGITQLEKDKDALRFHMQAEYSVNLQRFYQGKPPVYPILLAREDTKSSPSPVGVP